MSQSLPPDPYVDGLHAAHRTGPYEGTSIPVSCPYPAGGRRADLWRDGFTDGAADFITLQRIAQMGPLPS